MIIFLLAVLLAGISYLVKVYGIAATDPGQPGYQSVLSMLTAAVFGKGVFYYVTIGSILVVLSLSANTAFADFPRLCRAIALNNYLPHVFGYRGRRLVYTYGIVVLALLCAGVLILFGGVTDRLIPLYAVGAFLAFTLSQSGMVMHWLKNRGPNWWKSALVNGFGALVTGITTGVVLVAKFVEGAWITLLFIPLTIVLFATVRRHYHSVKVLTSCKIPVDTARLSHPPIAVIAIDRWSNITRQGIEFAARLSPDVIALHVEPNEHSELLQDDWEHYVETTLPRGRQGAASASRPALTLPLHHCSCGSVHSRPFEKESRSHASSWSYRNWWKTNGTNISFTISGAGFWNGFFSPAGMSAFSR